MFDTKQYVFIPQIGDMKDLVTDEDMVKPYDPEKEKGEPYPSLLYSKSNHPRSFKALVRRV
jgi:hypothetical protein